MELSPHLRRILTAQHRAAKPWRYYGVPVEGAPEPIMHDGVYAPLEIWLMSRLGTSPRNTNTAVVIARSENAARDILIENSTGRERRDWRNIGKTQGIRIGIAAPEENEPRIVEKTE